MLRGVRLCASPSTHPPAGLGEIPTTTPLMALTLTSKELANTSSLRPVGTSMVLFHSPSLREMIIEEMQLCPLSER